MKLRCPVCHSSNSLDAYAADEAGRELLGVLAATGPLFRPFVQYLGLFRSAQRDLSHARALKLAKEVLAIPADPQALATAMQETVESIRAKQQTGETRPLKNHNYLKRVLESVTVAQQEQGARFQDQERSVQIRKSFDPNLEPAPKGKRAQGMAALAQWAETDWLKIEIAQGLIALIGLGREGAPAAETIIVTASLWETMLIDAGLNIEHVDQKRIKIGFKELLTRFEKWPEPKDLLARLPRRPERNRLDVPPPIDDIKKGKAFFKKLGRNC
ncbi:MAG: hypothetical protein L3J57_01730 [Desulfuromusa sp.]|nr:hypothetical protein [Desulfuromusa sp.]